MQKQNLDVLVVGGAAVGLATALAAHAADLSVQVLERAPAPVQPRSADTNALDADSSARCAGSVPNDDDHLVMPDESRVYALAPASVALLKSLDAWPERSGWFRPGFIRSMSVYERASRGQIMLARPPDDGGDFTMAAVVPHGQLIRALTEACGRAGVPIEYGQTVTAARNQPDVAVVETGQGDTYAARLLCAADGARSAVRDLLHIPVDGASYHQSGVTAVLSLSAPHGGVAWQHFRNGEVMAFLPLADLQKAVLVWSARDAHAEQLMGMPAPVFLKALNEAMALDGPIVTAAADRRRFPLRWQRALAMHEGRALLLGDAAHVIHPLAGQGLNLGFGDVAALATDLLPGLGQPGYARLLGRYVRARKADALMYRAATDGLFRLFNFQAARPLRGAGLSLVNRLGPLKRAIVERASGAQLAPEIFQKG